MKWPKLSITGKHFLVYLAICLVTEVTIAIYAYRSARQAIIDRTFEQLTSVRVEKSNHMERFFNDRIRDVKMVAASDAIRKMLDDAANWEHYGNSNLENDFTSYLNSYLKSSAYYTKIILVSSSGTYSYADLDGGGDDILFHYGMRDQGLPVESLVERIKGANSPCLQDYALDKGESGVFIGQRVGDSSGKGFSGAVILEIAVASVNSMMYENNPNNGLGATGEAYIVGSDYLIRTASRFQNNSILRTRVETEGSRRALAGLTGTGIFNDYRGIRVLSSYSKLHVPDLNWVILAEIDNAEAMIPVYSLRNDILIISIVFFLCILAVVYLISRRMTLPVIRLKHATSQIAAGDYHLKLKVDSSDELGMLTDSFNHMAEQLELQKEQIREARLKRISSMIDGQEMERQRLSRDLHDGLGQSILAVKMKLEQAKGADSEKNHAVMLEALELIRGIIREIRSISYNLMPPVLAAFGLERGLRTLCKEASSASMIDIRFNCEWLPDAIDNMMQIYLYRIIQEAVHNITRHSQADTAEVKLFGKAGMLCISIHDNGHGFDFSNSELRGNGINNIIERVELLGGICNFASGSKKGTTIEIQIPIEQ